MSTNTQKKLLSPDVIALIDAGFMSECLKITDNGRYYLEHLMFMEKMGDMVKRAKEINSEKCEDKCEVKPKKLSSYSRAKIPYILLALQLNT